MTKAEFEYAHCFYTMPLGNLMDLLEALVDTGHMAFAAVDGLGVNHDDEEEDFREDLSFKTTWAFLTESWIPLMAQYDGMKCNCCNPDDHRIGEGITTFDILNPEDWRGLDEWWCKDDQNMCPECAEAEAADASYSYDKEMDRD